MSSPSSSSSSLPGPPDSLSTSASGFARNHVRRAAKDKAGDDTEIRLYWTLTDPDDGPGEPLVLINGLGSPLVAFEAGFVAEFLDRGFSVLRFDNRDVGRSSRVDDVRGPAGPPYSLTDLAADAVAVLDHVGWSTVHVVGQSMGGMIVQQMAIDHPQRLRSLTSLMSNTGEPGFGLPSNEAYAALVNPAPSQREPWLDDRVDTEKIWASPRSWDPQATRAKGALLFDYGIDVEGTGRQFRAVMKSGSRDVALAQVTVPTLVIHGQADTLIHPSGGRHTAEVISGARYVEIDGFGHDLPADFWPVLAKTITEFALTTT